MASSSSLLLCLCLWLLAHGPHAMRQSSYQPVLEDSMVCECKKVYSVTDCPNYKFKKDGFSPGFPRYYHDQDEPGMNGIANLCCRMANKTKTKTAWKKFMSPYVAEKDKDKCLEETRPLYRGGCCTLAGSTEVYGREFKIELMSAKVYSMAHEKMLPPNVSATEEDYAKKSNVFIEKKGLGRKDPDGDTINDPEKLGSEMKGIKELISKNGEDLQCKEDLADLVASMKNKGNKGKTCLHPGPVCCCRPDYLNAPPATCIKSLCAPKQNPVHLRARGKKEVEDPNYERLAWRDLRYYVHTMMAPIWPDLFSGCPKTHTAGLVKANQLNNGSCTKSTTIKLPAENKLLPNSTLYDKYWEHIPEREQELCVEALFHLPCPAGEVKYEIVRGWYVEGHRFSCPVGLKSNLPGDPEKDSRCQCDFDSSISLAQLKALPDLKFS